MSGRMLELADPHRVETLLDGLAAEIVPVLSRDSVLVGILRRGAPLAERLAERLERLGAGKPPVGQLSLKRYSDELELLHERPQLDEKTLDIDVSDRHLILVDDVIFTGESLFRAACHLRTAGARCMQIAVLCARGRPAMPVRADFVGCHLDIGHGWIIDCRVPPYEDELGIVVREAGQGPGSAQGRA